MFVYDKEKLPIPVLKGKEHFIKLYDAAWETAFRNVEIVDKEGWKPQLTCMPGAGIIWQWDSCFMTFITNYANGTLNAFNNLDNLYRLRRKSDGFMAMAYEMESECEAYPGRINPPLMAWAEWNHFCVTGDDSRFAEVLPALEGCYDFIENNRRRICGLYWFEDSGSSGMDNSPRSGYDARHEDGSDVCFIDLACQQALSAQCMAKICGRLGMEDKKAFYEGEHKRICELINRYHWSERSGWYFDFFARSNPDEKVKYINSKTAAAFWALTCGCAQGERKQRMLEHMFNKDEFYTLIPFPTLAKDDPNYDQGGGYWLGGVWPPTNYAAIRGLKDNGYPELAREAAIRYLEGMCKVAEDPAYGSIWEAYAPEAYRPATAESGVIVRANFVGWGGLAPITMLIENILGLTFRAEENTVHFNLFPETIGGLKNMQFCGGKVSVLCTDYYPAMGRSTVEVEAEKPFRLIVKTNYLWEPVFIDVEPGKHSYKI